MRTDKCQQQSVAFGEFPAAVPPQIQPMFHAAVGREGDGDLAAHAEAAHPFGVGGAAPNWSLRPSCTTGRRFSRSRASPLRECWSGTP
jgi:hypothetical protein